MAAHPGSDDYGLLPERISEALPRGLGRGGKEDSMLDYCGDMAFYQNQLAKKGITKDMLDMNQYAGLTAKELQGIVDSVYLRKEVSADGRENARAV